MTTQIAVRLPEDVLAELDKLVPGAHASRSEAIRRAIEMYVYRLQWEHDAAVYETQPLTESELALADAPGRWAGTPQW
jgi:metal-responsive CopG/Arc/MetJ family transcriptional regulator